MWLGAHSNDIDVIDNPAGDKRIELGENEQKTKASDVDDEEEERSCNAKRDKFVQFIANLRAKNKNFCTAYAPESQQPLTNNNNNTKTSNPLHALVDALSDKCEHGRRKEDVRLRCDRDIPILMMVGGTKWDQVLAFIYTSGHTLSYFSIKSDNSRQPWSLASYQWYPLDIVEKLVRTIIETNDPDEFVGYVQIEIPPFSGIHCEKTLAAMEAEPDFRFVEKSDMGGDGTYRKYEAKNRSTGRKFKVRWHPNGRYVDGQKQLSSILTIQSEINLSL